MRLRGIVLVDLIYYFPAEIRISRRYVFFEKFKHQIIESYIDLIGSKRGSKRGQNPYFDDFL